MTWHRLDDQFDDNPHQLALSDGAFRLWVCSWSFCARQRPVTGCMTETQALALARKLGKTAKTIAELVAAGRWEHTDDGYSVHDFSEHVERGSRERVAKHRATKKNGGHDPDGGSPGPKQRAGNVTSALQSGYGSASVTQPGVTCNNPPFPPPDPPYIPLPVPVPEPVPEPPRPPLAEAVSPLVARRAELLGAACVELLKRPLRGDERSVVLGWAALERDGESVGTDEILGLVAYLLAQPTRDRTPPGTLRYCDATVLALARAPWTGPTSALPRRGRGRESTSARIAALLSGAEVSESPPPEVRAVAGGAP